MLLINTAAFAIKELFYFLYLLLLRPKARPTVDAKAAVRRQRSWDITS